LDNIFGPSFLWVENAAPLATIHEHLKDPHGLAQHHAFVFVGEISRMETIHQHRCRPESEEKLEYRISLGIIEDSGEPFHAIQNMIESAR
jgi:hypothetical protein